MKIYKCGTIVNLKLLKIDAMITASCIRFGNITYEISYFNGNTNATLWVNEFEIATSEKKETLIGYKN